MASSKQQTPQTSRAASKRSQRQSPNKPCTTLPPVDLYLESLTHVEIDLKREDVVRETSSGTSGATTSFPEEADIVIGIDPEVANCGIAVLYRDKLDNNLAFLAAHNIRFTGFERPGDSSIGLFRFVKSVIYQLSHSDRSIKWLNDGAPFRVVVACETPMGLNSDNKIFVEAFRCLLNVWARRKADYTLTFGTVASVTYRRFFDVPAGGSYNDRKKSSKAILQTLVKTDLTHFDYDACDAMLIALYVASPRKGLTQTQTKLHPRYTTNYELVYSIDVLWPIGDKYRVLKQMAANANWGYRSYQDLHDSLYSSSSSSSSTSDPSDSVDLTFTIE